MTGTMHDTITKRHGPDYFIREVLNQDEDSIRTKWRKYFEPIPPQDWLIETVLSDNPSAEGFAACAGPRPIGYGFVRFLTDVQSEMGLDEYDDFPTEPDGCLTAVLWLTVIDPNYRGKGIATDLATRRLKLAIERDCDRMMAISFGAGKGVCENIGLKQIDTIPGYFDHENDTALLWERWL